MLLNILRAAIDIIDNAADLLGATKNYGKKPYKPKDYKPKDYKPKNKRNRRK